MRHRFHTFLAVKGRHAPLAVVCLFALLPLTACKAGDKRSPTGDPSDDPPTVMRPAPLPHDEDARRMLLEPNDLPSSWLGGGAPDLATAPCASIRDAPTGAASIVLVQPPDDAALQIHESVRIFDTLAANAAITTSYALSARCFVDALNRGEVDNADGTFGGGTLTLFPSPNIADASAADETAYDSTSRAGRRPPVRVFFDSVEFVDDRATFLIRIRRVNAPLSSDERQRIVDLALQKERAARGIGAAITPAP